MGPIGIDIEYRDPARDLDRLAEAAYGAEECRAVAACGISAFYRIWTVREAISKATGDGMALVTTVRIGCRRHGGWELCRRRAMTGCSPTT